MARVYCSIFDIDLYKRKSYELLCKAYKYNTVYCKNCQNEYHKINKTKLQILIDGIIYFSCKSNYYFNGQTIPNNGHISLINKAKSILKRIRE